MAGEDENPTMRPAPLPRHERDWRHPSEIGQQRRAMSRRSAPPLSPIVGALCGALGVALIVGLVALVVPPDSRRETTGQVRNAAIDPAPAAEDTTRSLPGMFTLDKGRFLLNIVDASTTYPLFVTTGRVSGVVVDDSGETRMRVVRYDATVDLTVFTNTSSRVRTLPESWSTRLSTPRAGSPVVIRGREETRATVGISTRSNVDLFVPLAGDVMTADVTESAVVEDANGSLLGLYVKRDGAHGYVPISVIQELASRS